MLYYLFNLKLEDINSLDILFPEIEVKFNSIILSNENDIEIRITNRKVIFEKTDRLNEYLLFVEDDNNEDGSFEYLFNEDYEIEEFNINFYANKINEDYTTDKINLDIVDFRPNCNFTEKDVLLDFLDSLMTSVYLKNTICIEGHKPNDMFGYDIEKKEYKLLALDVANCLEKQIKKNEITHILNGADLGFDTISFFAVEYLKNHGYPSLKNILVIPYSKIDDKWSAVDKDRFQRMKESADYVIYADSINDYTIDLVPIGEYHSLKNNKKSFFMIDNSKILLSNWDKTSGYIQNVVAYAIRKGRININVEYERRT